MLLPLFLLQLLLLLLLQLLLLLLLMLLMMLWEAARCGEEVDILLVARVVAGIGLQLRHDVIAVRVRWMLQDVMQRLLLLLLLNLAMIKRRWVDMSCARIDPCCALLVVVHKVRAALRREGHLPTRRHVAWILRDGCARLPLGAHSESACRRVRPGGAASGIVDEVRDV